MKFSPLTFFVGLFLVFAGCLGFGPILIWIGGALLFFEVVALLGG